MALINALAAQAFIVSHDHKATFTPDGLLAITWVATQPPKEITWEEIQGDDCDDIWFEEPHVFPIDNNGMVDMGSIRAWLGY